MPNFIVIPLILLVIVLCVDIGYVLYITYRYRNPHAKHKDSSASAKKALALDMILNMMYWSIAALALILIYAVYLTSYS